MIKVKLLFILTIVSLLPFDVALSQVNGNVYRAQYRVENVGSETITFTARRRPYSTGSWLTMSGTLAPGQSVYSAGSMTWGATAVIAIELLTSSPSSVTQTLGPIQLGVIPPFTWSGDALNRTLQIAVPSATPTPTPDPDPGTAENPTLNIDFTLVPENSADLHRSVSVVITNGTDSFTIELGPLGMGSGDMTPKNFNLTVDQTSVGFPLNGASWKVLVGDTEITEGEVEYAPESYDVDLQLGDYFPTPANSLPYDWGDESLLSGNLPNNINSDPGGVGSGISGNTPPTGLGGYSGAGSGLGPASGLVPSEASGPNGLLTPEDVKLAVEHGVRDALGDTLDVPEIDLEQMEDPDVSNIEELGEDVENYIDSLGGVGAEMEAFLMGLISSMRVPEFGKNNTLALNAGGGIGMLTLVLPSQILWFREVLKFLLYVFFVFKMIRILRGVSADMGR